MSGQLGGLLDELYRKDRPVRSMEKTAEDALAAALRTEGQVSDNPYAEMSTSDLADLALRLESEKTAGARTVGSDIEKVAMDTLGGKVMAHALIHEFGLIKEAMANGLCRVCKENQLDIEGTSICSACQTAE